MEDEAQRFAGQPDSQPTNEEIFTVLERGSQQLLQYLKDCGINPEEPQVEGSEEEGLVLHYRQLITVIADAFAAEVLATEGIEIDQSSSEDS